MLGIENLVFASPWVLGALIITPILWWLLRIMPPTPRRIPFPAIALLRHLDDREQTPDRTPLWLVLLRLLIVVLVVLGLAQPLLNPPRSLPGTGPILIVLDNGWDAAPNWSRLQSLALRLTADADRNGRAVGLALTAPDADGFSIWMPRAATQTADILRSLTPVSWPADRAGLADRLAAAAPPTAIQSIWISSGAVTTTASEDGAREEAATALATRLQRMGGLDVVMPEADTLPLLLLPPSQGDGRLTVTMRRSQGGPEAMRYIRLQSRDGGILDRKPVTIAEGDRDGTVVFELPLKVRNRAASVSIEGEQSAGARILLDERWQRRPVGLVSGEQTGSNVPLLSELYYLERALAPYAELHEGDIDSLLQQGLAVLIMADLAPLAADVRARLRAWMRDGGVLVRFAGPQLASEPDDLIPVRLRLGDRTLGGALSWTEPAHLAPFDETSPFAGLSVPNEITVSRQVLAQPSLELSERTWARLADGTPLVTAHEQGQGWLVLVHTTAGVDWSNLALSGLYVDLLRRMLDLGRNLRASATDRPLRPLRVLNGFGQLQAAPPLAAPIEGNQFQTTTVSPRHPPGYYGDRASRHALNLTASVTAVMPLTRLPAGVTPMPLGGDKEVDFKPWLLTAALLLFLCDLLLALFLRGLLKTGERDQTKPRRSAATGRRTALLVLTPLIASAMAGLLAGVIVTGPAQAEVVSADRARGDDAFALLATSDTYLAYVKTGEPGTDATIQAGLTGLARVLTRRTAAETAGALGVDVETDELAFFPLLYWAITPSQATLSDQARRQVNQYLNNGGTILFDTRQQRLGGPLFGGGAAAEALQRATQGLNIPPLQPVPPDHVLTKAFYLMQEFPGRFRGGDVWVETTADRDRDGVSSVIIGSNDWATAWAVDETGRPTHPVIPGGERQREMAYRFGVNLVMYTLTGNYKADQVHVPAILERLGQ